MENLSLGISLTVVGMGIVFIILFLLQLFMNGEAWLFTARNSNSEEQADVQPKTVSQTQEEVAVQNLSPQVIAAITAAIAFQTGRPAQSFRLVNVRQAADREASAVWNFQGRTDLINTRSSFYAKGGSK